MAEMIVDGSGDTSYHAEQDETGAMGVSNKLVRILLYPLADRG